MGKNPPHEFNVVIEIPANLKNIIVDGYDFCKEIDKLKQSKYKFSNPQSVIDLSEASVVDTQQDESGAEWLLGINEKDFFDLGLNDLEGYLDKL